MEIRARAPGRVCLFGDHQDYLALPVIATAIDRFVTISGVPNGADSFSLAMPDLGKKFDLPFSSNPSLADSKNISAAHTAHLIHTLSVVRRYGCIPNTGYAIEITSTVPINAGLSSSSAVVVAWVRWLLEAFGCDQEITPQLIGQLAYEAEVLEAQSSGGKMDQYTSAIGGIIHLETDESNVVTVLGSKLEGLIIGESGVPKDTEGLLGDLSGNQKRVLEKAAMLHPGFNKKSATLEDYEQLKISFSAVERPFLYAAIKNHLITQKALVCFRESDLNLKTLGNLMNAHHTVLKTSLKITVPRIDAMIDAALDAGAYGAKIVGSGGGGSICVLSPKGSEENIITAIKNAGAADAYAVHVAQGTHIL